MRWIEPSTFTCASRIGLARGDRDARLRGLVADDVGPERLDDAAHGVAVAYVDLAQHRAGRNALALAGRQVVEDLDRMTARQQGVGDVTSDEPGSAGDERLHFSAS